MNKQRKYLRFYAWLCVICMSLLWLFPNTGCQCSPGIVSEIPNQEGYIGGKSYTDGSQADGNSNNSNPDGNNSNPDGSNGNPDGSNGSPDGNNGNPDGNNGNPDGNNGNPDGSNGNPDGSNGNPDGSNGNPDGNNGNPDGLPDDDQGGCGKGRVIGVPSTLCQSRKQVCVQGNYICSPKVELRNGHFVIDGKETFVHGVVYNPIPKCKPYNYDFTDQPSTYKRDFPVLQSMGKHIVLRMVRPISTRAFLDAAYQHSLRLIVGFAIKWQQDFATTCPQLRTLWRAQLKFYQHHPAILAYSIGEQTALHILNSTLPNKEQRLKNWYQCLNQLAAEVNQIEGKYHRPVTTVSGAHPNERLGDPRVKADEASLSNIDFHTFQVFEDVQVNSWLQGSQRKKFKKPVLIGSYGIDACNYQPTTKRCRIDQDSQARAMLNLARDTQAAFGNPLSSRVAGGIAAAYSDELWAGDPTSDICGQNASGYPHGFFPDGFFNLEWFGLVDIHTNPSQVQPRKAFRELANLWNQRNAWPASNTRNITIQSHQNGAVVPQQFLISGTFSGFQKKLNEDWAAFFVLIRPYKSADNYPMFPIALCCGFGTQEWTMALQVGRKQDIGKKFELIPAYTTNRASYEQMLKTSFFITKPAGLTILKAQSVLVTRK